MINQKESKQVRMSLWLLKLPSRNLKTKTKNKLTEKKAMGNITPTMHHYPRNGQMGDTDP